MAMSRMADICFQYFCIGFDKENSYMKMCVFIDQFKAQQMFTMFPSPIVFKLIAIGCVHERT